jgi:ABC-type branched-subunit amino acid transport system ATPase component
MPIQINTNHDRAERMAAPQPILELDGLHVTYGGGTVTALSGLSVRVLQGEVVALLGVNGAGKTTTLRTISGLLPYNGGTLDSGVVRFLGADIRSLDPWQRVTAGISMAMEGRRVFGDLSVAENLAAGGFSIPKRDFRANRDRVLELFPILRERTKQLAGLLSGGEQQMLAIARALIQSPKLLLLDEPSLGLAPLIVDRIKHTIHEINAQGTSILLIEQNAAMGLSVANYAYVIEGRRIAREGTGSELLADESIRDLYLGIGSEGRRSHRQRAQESHAAALTEVSP